MKHVIIGAGAAGIMAARTIRQRRPEDEIVMLSTDRQVHSRCMLHKYISGERDEATLSFVDGDFFEKNRIQWQPGVTVEGIDTAGKQVAVGGKTESYDKLLIATGAESVIPPIGSLSTATNVYGLRHLSDAKAIRDRAAQAQRIVVIGAGLVGLDAAYGLLELGKKPVVVEMAPSILALNLDPHGAAAYQQRFEAAGCAFRLGRKVMDTIDGESGEIRALSLDDGEALACDMVIVAVGVRPATGLLRNSGIVCERSIQVDDTLATSAADVYAAGDVAGLSGIWPNAMKQGEVAAKNMCGISAVYDDRYALKNTINFFGFPSLSVGRLQPDQGDVVLTREDQSRYQKVILRDGMVTGVILQGDIGSSGFWQYLIKNRVNIANIEKPIWKLSYADFYAVGDRGEYRWPEYA